MRKLVLSLSIAAFALTSCSEDSNLNSDPVVVKPVDGGVVAAKVGGPNQPNTVYVDLSSNAQTTSKRDVWDLGFSSGSDFRVIINGSVKMAVKKLETTNIDEVQTKDDAVAVGYTTMANWGYVDNPTGILTGNGNGNGTAIAEIAANEANNYVYLVNMGYHVGTTTPAIGSVALDGESRGWKKIRITRDGDNYVIDYANLNETTHKTIKVTKKAEYNFTFISLSSGQEVNVQPAKKQWDFALTGFTNYFMSGQDQITYYFSDFVSTNILGGTKVYMVQSSAENLENDYAAFTKNNVIEANFTASANDQRIIGSGWRNGGGPNSQPSIKDNLFYVLKDVDGNLFKLKFIALTNDAGERGNPVFEYALLK